MAKQRIDFKSYSLEDFINDKDFVLWGTMSTEALDQYWSQVAIDFPEKQEIISNAKMVVQSIKFKSDLMPDTENQKLWQSIAQQTTKPKRSRPMIPLWLKSFAAAAVLFLIFDLLFSYYKQHQKIEISTAFGVVRSVSLPDGTVITMNANSVLSYLKSWDQQKIREVWITGEAFLNVNHLHRTGKVRPGDQFIVHLNDVDVEVLGTSFNVNDRRGQVKVALLTGKISLKTPVTQNEQTLTMSPGEVVEYAINKPVKKSKINVREYASWKDGMLHFNNTPISAVFNYIEDVYGDKAMIQNEQIKAKKLSGTFSIGSEDALLKAISTSLGISIEKHPSDHQLIIK
jgi:transmembrane sensor